MAYTTSNGSVEGFNLTYILGWLFAPLAWLLGVPWGDTLLMGQLLGQKTVLNEFVAYGQLSEIIDTGKFLHQKTIIIATYALCGFANFGSIGVQIAGISAIAPGQRKNLTSLGLKSLVGGTIACFLTAIIAGIIV